MCALTMIRDTKAHCVITPKHRTICKMVDYDKLIQSRSNELCPNITGKRRSLTNNGYYDGNIDLTHRQGLTGVPVKLPYGASI